jgi:hypothetical protein
MVSAHIYLYDTQTKWILFSLDAKKKGKNKLWKFSDTKMS